MTYFITFYSVLHRMRLIGPVHSSQCLELHNSGITTLKHAIVTPSRFLEKFLGILEQLTMQK